MLRHAGFRLQCLRLARREIGEGRSASSETGGHRKDAAKHHAFASLQSPEARSLGSMRAKCGAEGKGKDHCNTCTPMEGPLCCRRQGHSEGSMMSKRDKNAKLALTRCAVNVATAYEAYLLEQNMFSARSHASGRLQASAIRKENVGRGPGIHARFQLLRSLSQVLRTKQILLSLQPYVRVGSMQQACRRRRSRAPARIKEAAMASNLALACGRRLEVGVCLLGCGLLRRARSKNQNKAPRFLVSGTSGPRSNGTENQLVNAPARHGCKCAHRSASIWAKPKLSLALSEPWCVGEVG